MKLQAILEVKEDPSALSKRYFNDFDVYGSAVSARGTRLHKPIKMRTKLIDETGKDFQTNIESLTIYPKVSKHKFYWPFEQTKSMVTLVLGDAHGWNENCPALEDFTALPNNFEKYMLGVYLKSFNGIDTLRNMKYLVLNIQGDFVGGVLKILKAPKLETLVVSAAQMHQMSDKLKQVLTIVQKHVKNKDLIECQNELLDAGFDEYAKL